MPDQLEIRVIEQMADIAFVAREKIIHADYVMAFPE
jgi:hypothetical protein